MTIQQQVLLRHRSDGHLRFDLPAGLAAPGIAERLVAGLRALEGVYRVELSSRQSKLSIRYQEFVCGFAAVVKRLYALIGELATQPGKVRAPAPVASSAPTLANPAPESAFQQWRRAKWVELQETAAALGIVTRQAFDAVRQRPRWIQEFANDLLMLFLIKLHWDHITTLWMRQPWTYRYEWMATFYLIYLHVQSKLPARA